MSNQKSDHLAEKVTNEPSALSWPKDFDAWMRECIKAMDRTQKAQCSMHLARFFWEHEKALRERAEKAEAALKELRKSPEPIWDGTSSVEPEKEPNV